MKRDNNILFELLHLRCELKFFIKEDETSKCEDLKQLLIDKFSRMKINDSNWKPADILLSFIDKRTFKEDRLLVLSKY